MNEHTMPVNSYGLPHNASIAEIFTKHNVMDDYGLGIAVSPCGKVCDYADCADIPSKLKRQWEFCRELEQSTKASN